MKEVKWIKLSVDTFADQKINVIRSMKNGDTIYTIWTGLLMLAGRINDDGMIYFTKKIPYTKEMLAGVFYTSVDVVECALKTFESFEMIELTEVGIRIVNWDRHQNIERLKEIREKNKFAKRKQRAKKEELFNDNIVDNKMTDIGRHDAIELDIDLELENKEEKENKEKKKIETSRFFPPTLEDVKAYCLERKNKIDPQTFMDFYQSKGWLVGKSQMKDWRAAVRIWEQREKEKAKPQLCY